MTDRDKDVKITMAHTRFPVLVRLNQYGVIEKVVIPDLFLDLTSSIPFYRDLFTLLGEEHQPYTLVREYLSDWLGEEFPILRDVKSVLKDLESEAQAFIDFHQLKDMTPIDESAWVVKKNGRPIQWEEMSVRVPQSTVRCKNIMTPLVIITYVLSTLLDAYLGYYTNSVNSVPTLMAAMTVATDILTTTPDFFASGIEENSDRFFSCSPKKIVTFYQLSEDFIIEERIVGKKSYWVLGGIFFIAQCVSSGSMLVSEYVNNMYQYDLAYSENYVPSGFPYKFYKGLAIASFILDNAFEVIIPFSTMITVGPKVGKLIEKVAKKCHGQCRCCRKESTPITLPVSDEKRPDENKVDVIIRDGYDRIGLFGIQSAAGLRTRLINNHEMRESEPDKKYGITDNKQPKANRCCFPSCTIL